MNSWMPFFIEKVAIYSSAFIPIAIYSFAIYSLAIYLRRHLFRRHLYLAIYSSLFNGSSQSFHLTSPTFTSTLPTQLLPNLQKTWATKPDQRQGLTTSCLRGRLDLDLDLTRYRPNSTQPDLPPCRPRPIPTRPPLPINYLRVS